MVRETEHWDAEADGEPKAQHDSRGESPTFAQRSHGIRGVANEAVAGRRALMHWNPPARPHQTKTQPRNADAPRFPTKPRVGIGGIHRVTGAPFFVEVADDVLRFVGSAERA